MQLHFQCSSSSRYIDSLYRKELKIAAPVNPIFWRGWHSIDLNGQFHPILPWVQFRRSSSVLLLLQHANLVTWSSFQISWSRNKTNERTVFRAAICRWHFQTTQDGVRVFAWGKNGELRIAAAARSCELCVGSFSSLPMRLLQGRIILTTFSE